MTSPTPPEKGTPILISPITNFEREPEYSGYPRGFHGGIRPGEIESLSELKY